MLPSRGPSQIVENQRFFVPAASQCAEPSQSQDVEGAAGWLAWCMIVTICSEHWIVID